jgi:hypothetical protein
VVGLRSNAPSTSTKPTLLHTCAASARLNDAPPRAAAAAIKVVLVRVAGLIHKQSKFTAKLSVAFILGNAAFSRQN